MCVCEWPLTEKTQELSQKESTQKARGEIDELWRTYMFQDFPVEFCQAVGMWQWMTTMQLDSDIVLEVPEGTAQEEDLTAIFYETLDHCLHYKGQIPERPLALLVEFAHTVFPLWFEVVEQY